VGRGAVVPEQATILASFNAHHFRRLKEEELKYMNDTHFEQAIEISHQRAATEEASRLLMAADRQGLLEMNVQRQAEAAARKKSRLTQNKDSRQTMLRGSAVGKLRRRRRPCSSARCVKLGRRGGHACTRQQRGRTTIR
jgi:hypothetical protein